MKKMASFDPEIEDVLLWANPVRGSFSFLSPMGSRITMWNHLNGWIRMESKSYMGLVVEYGWDVLPVVSK